MGDSDWEALGGEAAVRGHVDAFVGRFFDDFIIGFMFEGKDRARIVRHEVEMAARHLGGDLPYTGRPLARTHRALRINRGQFRRRLAIVRTVLTDRGVDPAIVQRWQDAERRLEDVVTDGSDCVVDPTADPTRDPVND